jgi:Beta-L-arabinofuranosidase, GH127
METMSESSVNLGFSPTALIGWRIQQARESGLAGLLGEVTSREHGFGDAAGIRAVRAALLLQRWDLVGDALTQVDQTIASLDRVGRGRAPRAARSTTVAPTSEEISKWADLVLLAADLRRYPEPQGNQVKPHSIDLEALVDNVIAVIRSHPSEGRGMFIEVAAALTQTAAVLNNDVLRKALVSTATTVVESVGGRRMARMFDLGGNSHHVVLLLQTLAALANEPRHGYLKAEALRQFDNLITTRLYVTGAVGQQPGSQLLVRPFGLSHSDGTARPCDTLALLNLIEAMRPLLVNAGRPTQADELIELITFNAVLLSLSTDSVHWYGPMPHAIDANSDVDVFSVDQPTHPVLGKKWRAQLRSPGAEHQCCAASALISLFVATKNSVVAAGTTITVNQLTPCDVSGDGWSMTIAGHWPYDEHTRITTTTDVVRNARIRIPEWATDRDDAGSFIDCEIQPGTHHIDLDIALTPRLLRAHPEMSDVRDRVCVALGPLVCCLEGADQIRHTLPHLVTFDPEGGLGVRRDSDHPEAYPVIHATGDLQTRHPWPDFPAGGWRAYRPWVPEPLDLPVEIVFIPLFAVANRGLWDVAMWLPLANRSF